MKMLVRKYYKMMFILYYALNFYEVLMLHLGNIKNSFMCLFSNDNFVDHPYNITNVLLKAFVIDRA